MSILVTDLSEDEVVVFEKNGFVVRKDFVEGNNFIHVDSEDVERFVEIIRTNNIER
jgi:hypothetical protein